VGKTLLARRVRALQKRENKNVKFQRAGEVLGDSPLVLAAQRGGEGSKRKKNCGFGGILPR